MNLVFMWLEHPQFRHEKSSGHSPGFIVSIALL